MKKFVGLTGGIGSGKSTVAGMLKDLGAYVVDADAIAREVVEPGSPGFTALVAEFGESIVSDGSLNRQALADIAFADPVAKAQLDAITHPLIRHRTAELVASASAEAIVVHDIALLVELNLQSSYDLVVVVDCPDDLRVQRLVGRGLVESDARARIAAQASRDQRLAAADVVIDNSGDVETLAVEVDRVWNELLDN